VALPGYSRTEAVRLAAQEEEQEITLADVESYAKEKGIPADGDAYRSLAMERMIRAQAHGVPVESTVDEEAEMERIAESRGLEVPEMPQVAASEATAEVEEHDAELEKIAKERGYAV
jgi:imidazolonepropionase-like amidohydrolase